MRHFGLVLFLGAFARAPGGTEHDAANVLMEPELAVERVAACGFKTAHAKFDSDLQEDVIGILEAGSASPMKLRCVAQASLETDYYVTFPAAVQGVYQAIYQRMAHERDQADAVAWLRKRKLLARLPIYHPTQTDERQFVRAIERLCGPKASGTLKPMGGMATFEEGALSTFSGQQIVDGALDDETLTCLTHAASASGYSLGFIGNAAEKPRP